MRDGFHWARLLGFVTGLVNQELLLRNEYLAAENRILRVHLPSRLRLSYPERSTLAEIGKAPRPLSATRMRVAMTDIDHDDLRAELADFAEPEKKGGRSPREERIIAGFEDSQRFVEKHGRTPQHGEDRDIFERMYAVRLDRLRALEGCPSL